MSRGDLLRSAEMANKPPAHDLQDAFVADFLRRVQAGLDEIEPREVDAIVDVLLAAHRGGHTVYLAGNGGSAATASHFGSDLHAVFRGHRRFRVSVLSDSVSVLTATANDHGWENVFADQLLGRVEPGDVVMILSASGESENVLRALEVGREQGAATVVIAGFGGGAATELADRCIVLSSHDYGVVESVHASLAHVIAACLRRHVGV